MHPVFALLCFVVVIYWLIFPYPSGLLHWHCGNLTIAPVPVKQPWWIWKNTSCEFIMNDCRTTTKQSTTKPCAYFLGYTVYSQKMGRIMVQCETAILSNLCVSFFGCPVSYLWAKGCCRYPKILINIRKMWRSFFTNCTHIIIFWKTIIRNIIIHNWSHVTCTYCALFYLKRHFFLHATKMWTV